MRKNSVRKFIHAVIDVLPLLVIPIFALNILHKETEPISIEVQEKVSVDFNQLVPTESIVYTEEIITPITNEQWGAHYFSTSDFENRLNHIMVCKQVTSNNNFIYRNGNNNLGIYNIRFTLDNRYLSFYSRQFQFAIRYMGALDVGIYTIEVNLYDLTEMFGSGNEPTYEEFSSMFTNSYYEYTESQRMLVNKPSSTTYNNTDIGSQFIYTLYNATDKYFNMNNLFNMGSIYDWIQLNMFGDTAPLPVFIIWNIIVYEFFVDLLFLFYAVFMFVIDFAEKCLDRPFRRM